MTETATAGYHQVTPDPEVMLALGRFAGAVAHDFNNLLTAIGSYAELIACDVAPGTPMADDVAHLRKAAARATELARTLQRLAQAPATRPLCVGLGRHVQAAAGRHRERFGEAPLQVDLSVRDPMVFVDPGELSCALDALLANARSAQPQGATCRIRLEEVSGPIAGAPHLGSGAWARISVEDEGRGMDGATLRRACEPLFGSEPGVARGLGLSWVERFARASGGTMQLASAPGRGTTASIVLPLATAATAPVRSTQQEDAT